MADLLINALIIIALIAVCAAVEVYFDRPRARRDATRIEP